MEILKKLISVRWLFAMAGLVLLTSCVVVEEGPGPGPFPPDDGPRFCTREYEPVCARAGGDRRTFGNACEARRAGYRILRDGECRRQSDDDFGDEPRFCTREYRPVCARRGGNERTFGNACEAEAANYRIVAPGEC